MTDEKKCDHNQIHLGPEIPGTGMRFALRHVNGETTPVIARPIADGQALPPGTQIATGNWTGNVIDVHETFRVPGVAPQSEAHHGPAKVTSDAYRAGWDSIFGGRQPAGSA